MKIVLIIFILSNLLFSRSNTYIGFDYLKENDLLITIEGEELNKLDSKGSGYIFKFGFGDFDRKGVNNRFEFSYEKYSFDWKFLEHSSSAFAMQYILVYTISKKIKPYFNLGFGLVESDIDKEEGLEYMNTSDFEFRYGIGLYTNITKNIELKIGYETFVHPYKNSTVDTTCENQYGVTYDCSYTTNYLEYTEKLQTIVIGLNIWF